MTDPKFWGDGMRNKLCFLHGYLLAQFANQITLEDKMLHTMTDEQIVESIIRILARSRGQLDK